MGPRDLLGSRWRGVAALVVLCLAPVGLWAFETGLAATAGTSGWLSAVATVSALMGFSAFACNIILGARVRAVGRFVGGLEQLYRLHRGLGRVAYGAVLVHVSFTVASRSLDSLGAGLRLLTPGAGAIVFAGVVAFAAMSLAIAATLYVRLTNETFIYVQRSFGLIFGVASVHGFSMLARGGPASVTMYLGGLSAAALVAFIHRSVLSDLLVRRYDYLVTEVRELDPMVVEITMEPIGRGLSAAPGQFVFVTFYSDAFNAQFHPFAFSAAGDDAVITLRPGQARNQFHPFSLTSPAGSRHLSFVVKAVGDFTAALHKLDAGAAARVEGPYGEFSNLNAGSARQVWLAGGIGITPFLSMARSLEPGYEVDLYWGVATRDKAFFLPELEEIARRLPQFRVFLVAEDTDGFISPELVARHSGLQDRAFLLVGPPAMQRALVSQLEQAGVPAQAITSERFAFGPSR